MCLPPKKQGFPTRGRRRVSPLLEIIVRRDDLARPRVGRLSTVAYGDSEAQCLLTDGAGGPLHRFRDLDHGRFALRVCLKIANVFLRPRDTLSSFSHQFGPLLIALR